MGEWSVVEMSVSGANPGTFTTVVEGDDEDDTPTTTDLLLAMFPSTVEEG